MIKLNKHGLISKRLIANEFIVGNTFIGVNGAPEDLTVLNLTKEEMDILSYIINSEGRNIPIDENGKIETKIGHTYVITTTEIEVTVTDADFNKLCKVPAHTQMGFVAKSALSYVDNVTCTVTEVFKAAAPIMLSENGSGKPKGDYVILDANGCITGGRLDTLENGNNLQRGKELTKWDIDLPKLSSANQMFPDSYFDKESTIFILNSIPVFSDDMEHILTLGVDDSLFYDPEVNTAINEAKNKGWNIIVKCNNLNDNILPQGYKRLEYLEGSGFQYINTLFIPDNNTGLYTKHLCLSNGNIRPVGQIESVLRMYAISVNYPQGLAYGFGQTYHPATCKERYDRLQTGYVNFLNGGMEHTYLEIDGLLLHGIHSNGVSFACDYSIYIFGLNHNDTLANNFIGRIYRVKITQEDSVVHDFIPALDDTGTPCMYDITSHQPFYNSGTSDFICPTNNTTYSLRRVLPDWGKLTPTGLRRLYHAPEGYTGELYDYALENGYKPIIEPEKPSDGYWTPKWCETEDEIVLEWVETEPPMDLETQI